MLKLNVDKAFSALPEWPYGDLQCNLKWLAANYMSRD